MENSNATQLDVIVVGAGLVGLAAVIALTEQGKRVALVDAKERQDYSTLSTWDSRIYAITPSTEAYLKTLGVWPFVDVARVNAVEAVALWHQCEDSLLHLSADDANLDKVACIIENNNLMQALWHQVNALDVVMVLGTLCADIQHQDNTVLVDLECGQQIRASLLVAADGVNSFVRTKLDLATKRKDFNQMALVANYQVEHAHANVARQWFAPHETLALLPLPQQQVSMVWALETERAQVLLDLPEEALAEQVGIQTQQQLGQLTAISKTVAFPLYQVTATQLIGERAVLVGDAAHQVHPMAGQGANLGFRDVMSLVRLIGNSHALADIGETSFLRRYERDRKADVVSMNMLTSGLDYWFASNHQLMKQLTTSGMKQLEKQAMMKHILIKQAVA